MANVPGAYAKVHEEEIDFRRSVSDGLLKKWAAAINKALAEGSITPLGAVAKSLLTEEQFQAEQGPGWILADGRSVVGSAYEALTGNAVAPDLRGVLTRMKDNGAGNFPEKALGEYQADELKIHGHTYTWDTTGMIITDNFALFNDDSDVKKSPLPQQSLAYTIGNTGANETRARSITVNFFIKIN